jgi:hypothetical protein
VRTDGLKYYVEQPKFLTHSANINIVAKSGVPFLLGSFFVPDLPGQMELHIITPKPSRVGESRPVDGETKWMQSTRMDIRRYRLSVEDGVGARVAMLTDGSDPSKILEALARDGTAALSLCASVPSVPGQHSVHEDSVEVRYPTDFLPVGINWLGMYDGLYVAQRKAARNRFRSHFFGPPVSYSETSYPFMTPPTVFEIKNTGSSIQWDCGEMFENSGITKASLLVRQVELSGFTRRLNSSDPAGQKLYNYYPRFMEQKTAENRALPVGKWLLQAFCKRPAPFNDIEITIVRIKTNKVLFTHEKP